MIETEQYEYAYLFNVRKIVDQEDEVKVLIDSWYDVSGWQTLQLKDAALGDNVEAKKLRHILFSMQMRVRHNPPDMTGPYLVKSHDVSDVATVEQYLQALSPQERRKFLTAARI